MFASTRFLSFRISRPIFLFTPSLRCQDFIAKTYDSAVQGIEDMGLSQMTEAKGFIAKGKYKQAVAPLQEAIDIFVGAGPAAWEYSLKAQLLLSHCFYQLQEQSKVVDNARPSFEELTTKLPQDILASPQRLAYVIYYACALVKDAPEMKDETTSRACGVALRRLAESPAVAKDPRLKLHLLLLLALISRDSLDAKEGLQAANTLSLSHGPQESSFYSALTLLVQGLIQHHALLKDDREALLATAATFARARQVLEHAYGAEVFSGVELTQEDQQRAADLFSSLLQAEASVHMNVMRLPPLTESDGERPPDPQALAAELLSRALALNRAVSPEKRNNPKAEAILTQLYSLYFEIGLYVQVSGIYNTLMRCLEQLHGPRSPQVLDLMHRQHNFLKTTNSMREAAVLAEQIAELQASP